ncbi:hypothetical protein [uncultured Clostridium sp.]|uniref:hypothetical protein n=1 Tax=uncultured Clostridium sp. TaxID=59620 RepID=UPI002672C6BF|nr:hypothetical protein [uncultured Clostridium sp.]
MSNLINKTRLQKFAEGFWDKVKRRYDGTFKDATITASTETEKKITLTKVDNTTKEISLADYARLQDRNEFKKDVSVDDAGYADNSKMGQATSTVNPSQRTIGARNLSSALFTDGFVSKLRVYVEDSVTIEPYIHIWAINKNSTKTQDTTNKKLEGRRVSVQGTAGNKYIDIPINETFTNDVYFILRTSESLNFKAIDNIDPSFADDVINLVPTTPPTTGTLNWGNAITTKTGKFELYGRIGIVDLNKKIEKVSADSSLYVKQDEVSTTSVANKVVRLGADGKLDKDMLPSIAINEYFEITDFTDSALQGKRYENGDVAVVTGSGANSGKRYLCINKGTSNATTEFIELNSKDGAVLSVNGRSGAVELNLEATDDKFKLKISGTGGAEVVKELDIISEADINSIISGLN